MNLLRQAGYLKIALVGWRKCPCHDGTCGRRPRRPAPLGDLRRGGGDPHGAIAAGMVTWHESIEAAGCPAIVIEFAPVLAGPTLQQTELPPGPEMVMSDARQQSRSRASRRSPRRRSRQKVEAKVEQEGSRKSSRRSRSRSHRRKSRRAQSGRRRAAAAEEVKRKPANGRSRARRRPTTSAPQFVPDQVAAIPAAPIQGQLNPNSRQWQPGKRKIVAFNRAQQTLPGEQPSLAAKQGIALVVFTLDRQGNVTDSHCLT